MSAIKRLSSFWLLNNSRWMATRFSRTSNISAKVTRSPSVKRVVLDIFYHIDYRAITVFD